MSYKAEWQAIKKFTDGGGTVRIEKGTITILSPSINKSCADELEKALKDFKEGFNVVTSSLEESQYLGIGIQTGHIDASVDAYAPVLGHLSAAINDPDIRVEINFDHLSNRTIKRLNKDFQGKNTLFGNSKG